MSETSESPTARTDAMAGVVSPPRHDYADHRPTRLLQVLAWVGIIAGVVFIVAVIFFSGFVAGRASGGYSGWHHGYQGGQMGPGGTWPGGMMGPGGTGPAQLGPGGMMGPGQPSTTRTPPFTQRPS